VESNSGNFAARKVRCRCQVTRFLELDGALLVQHAQVVVAETGGDLGREDLLVGVAEDPVDVATGEVLEHAITNR